ncbi:Uncharacterised protein [Vibrio cholerae]|nr:Uncharacterised protein [Vibrio cholerae]CSB12689.1 Uncharacterised protein [Vibrio cholerae]CSB97679.1 Uncharacterised protein [Vibrio cholerae]CSC05810.1 Uncharacterised protein [Vibrio cholerae]CSC14431.1 Uncharacterised protein [Vibrio cholerae]
MAATDFMGDVQLMRDQPSAHTTQATHWAFVLLILIGKSAITQHKVVHAIDLTGKQLILRFIKTNLVTEENFTQRDTAFFGIHSRT